MKIVIPSDNWKIARFLLVATVLSACQPLPPRGGNFVMVVKSIPTKQIQLQERPELSLALLRGVTRNDVTSGRLVLSHCYIQNDAPLTSRRFGFTILPEGTKVKARDVVEIAAEGLIDGDMLFSRFFGRYVGTSPSTSSDYFSHGTWENLFRCGSGLPSGAMRVEVISFAHYWDFDFARAEASRNSGISAEELRNGRIVVCECSPGVDSWAVWKVRLLPDMNVKVGDYIEAIAGSSEGSISEGPISAAVRQVVPPSKEHFVKTQGRYTVSCDALAIPYPTDN